MPRRTCSLWRLSSSSENDCRIKLWSVGIAIGFWFATGSTHAGPPFVTDDPEPPPPGGWEINVPFILERTPGKTEMDAPLFDLNYGLPDIQLKLQFPIEIVNEDSNGTRAGAGNSPKEHGGRSEVAFNVGGTWKLTKHLNLLFSGGRDIVGDTHAMAYIGLQLLTK